MCLKDVQVCYKWFQQNMLREHENDIRKQLNGSLTFYTYECSQCGKRKQYW